MSITATIDASRVKDKLNGSSNKILSRLKDSLYIQTGMLAEYIKREKLSGQVLRQSFSFPGSKNAPGNLRNNIFPLLETSGTQMTGTVYVGANAFYGKIQEYGAHIPERVAAPGSALRWYTRGGEGPIFAKRAKAFDLPPRPFMGPSLDEKAPEITAALQNSMNEAIKE